MLRRITELFMTTCIPLLLCSGGIYGVFFIGPMSDVPSKDSLRQARGQITQLSYEQGSDSPTIEFYVDGTPDPFLIRSDMGYLTLIATRLGSAKAGSQPVSVAYTTTQLNLIQGKIITLNRPWQLDILAAQGAAPVASQLLSYDAMVQVQKDDNQDMHWLGVLALCSGLTSWASLWFKRRRDLRA